MDYDSDEEVKVSDEKSRTGIDPYAGIADQLHFVWRTLICLQEYSSLRIDVKRLLRLRSNLRPFIWTWSMRTPSL